MSTSAPSAGAAAVESLRFFTRTQSEAFWSEAVKQFMDDRVFMPRPKILIDRPWLKPDIAYCAPEPPARRQFDL